MKFPLITIYDDFCYGARMLASFLRQHGHDVFLIHFKSFQSLFVSRSDHEGNMLARSSPAQSIEEVHFGGVKYCPYPTPVSDTERRLLVERLQQIQPAFIGFSVSTMASPVARDLTRLLKIHFPETKIIWGGIHPTTSPEECVECADIICIGEGENAILDLLNQPDSREIMNCWFKHPSGEIIKNPMRPLIDDLDSLPFASYGVQEELIDNDKIDQITLKTHNHLASRVVISTQRGCPFLCTYCMHHVVRKLYMGQRYVRRRSVDNVLREVAFRLKQFPLPAISFWDDVFLIDDQWIDEFCEKYPRRIGMPFGGYSYPTVTNENMIKKLQKAGMAFLSLGIQTGSDYIGRKVYHRNYSADKIVELAQWGEKYGLQLAYDLLSNNPFERKEDCVETLKMLLAMPKPEVLAVKKIRLFKHTEISRLDLPKGNLTDADFDFWNSLYLLTRDRKISPESILRLAENKELEANPHILVEVSDAVGTTVDENKWLNYEIYRLQTDATFSGLSRYMKRYLARHIPAPFYRALKHIYSLLGKKTCRRFPA